MWKRFPAHILLEQQFYTRKGLPAGQASEPDFFLPQDNAAFHNSWYAELLLLMLGPDHKNSARTTMPAANTAATAYRPHNIIVVAACVQRHQVSIFGDFSLKFRTLFSMFTMDSRRKLVRGLNWMKILCFKGFFYLCGNSRNVLRFINSTTASYWFASEDPH